jgi:predicted RNA-binding Zn ribbon-like protein
MPHSSTAARRGSVRSAGADTRPPRDRIWIHFVNTDAAAQGAGGDLLRDFDALVAWLHERGGVDDERAGGVLRRALLQPAAAAATLVEARRVRAALRALAERGRTSDKVRDDAVAEINRVLGRSAGTRRLEPAPAGGFTRTFVPTGDAFAGLMIPIVESAADSLLEEELPRVRRCADPRCHRVYLDATKNGLRRWCDMGTCGNRAKAARHRARVAPAPAPPRRA